MNRPYVHFAVLALGDAAALVALRPRWELVGAGLTHPASWLAADPDLALAATCVVLLWSAAAWVAVGLIAGVGARVPGATGRVCARFARVVVPKVLVRLVLGSTGLGLLAAPSAQAASLHPMAAAGPRLPASVALRVSDPVPAPTWPSAAPSSTTTSPTTATSTTPSGRPSGPIRLPAPAPPASTRPAPSHPHSVTPATPATPATRAEARVHSGDSLWLLAGHRLGSHADADDIARYWPQIYAANRDVIGDDPAVIHPGQVLHLPAPALPTEESR